MMNKKERESKIKTALSVNKNKRGTKEEPADERTQSQNQNRAGGRKHSGSDGTSNLGRGSNH